MSDSSKPVHFAVLLFPGFQLLDVAGPLDCLNLLSLTQPLTLSILSNNLAPVSTAIPNASTTASKGLFSQSMSPTHTFSEPPTEPIDVIFIPGGYGTWEEHTELKNFVKSKAGQASTIMTVCTGSGLLAQTGLLDGIQATGNKANWDWTTSQSARVDWVYKARWVESASKDGRTTFWTSSGVSAGMDQVLAWVSRNYGSSKAEEIAAAMEYRWERDSQKDDFAELYEHKWKKH
ncbi:class I glutamine amidotransferase-like protein [Meredithblackwellia eburnea MCA 4105]